MRGKLILLTIAVAAALSLAACGTQMQFTGATKRVIIKRDWPLWEQRAHGISEYRGPRAPVFCAEPSPDVTEAFSQALRAAVELGKPGKLSLSASSSVSFATSVAQLGERLAVIQLFRDRMYRMCEAYANGAVDEVAYTLMLARNDKTMAALLSTEMAAGAFGRSFAHLGGAASSSGGDPKKRAELRDKIIKLTDELTAIAKSNEDIANRQEKAKEKADELMAAHTELLSLDFAARTFNLSDLGSGPGAVTRRVDIGTPGDPSWQIENIHRNYIDDTGLEPLTDACLVAVSRVPLDTNQARELTTAKRNTLAAEQRLREAADGQPKIQAKVEDEQARREEQLKIYEVMLTAPGNPFAAFCLTDILGDIKEAGYVSRMIRARQELREIDKPTNKQVLMEKFKVCQALILRCPESSECQESGDLLKTCRQVLSTP